jgi:VIT1/CCC1 family predicted Fe2+/Mn2+ transporter
MTRKITNDQGAPKARPRLLDPVDRDSEFLSGLITALTFTCTLSVATAGNRDVGTVMLSALAGNVAGGVVDAVMYLLSCLGEREEGLLALRRVRTAKSTDAVRPIIEDALPESVLAVLEPHELDELRSRIARLPPPASRATLGRRDYLAAIAIFATVVLSTVPVILPLALIHDPGIAIRVSNATAVVLMHLFGRSVARATGTPPLRTEFAMVGIGIALVGITILLGG